MDENRSDSQSSSQNARPKIATAKWGAACMPCATAKAKCIRSDPSPKAKCDRCARLYKDCKVQVHKPRKKRQTKLTHAIQAEERLHRLVQLLRDSGESPKIDLNLDTSCLPSENDPLVADQSKPQPLSHSGTPFRPGRGPWSIPDTYNSYCPPTCFGRPRTGDAPEPPDTDANLLDYYRNELQLSFPFVIIPPNESAAALKSRRPFLMAAIRMVTSVRSVRSMQAQQYYLMKHLSEQMLIQSEKSLDLLLGIIVILGYHQYHCFMHTQIHTLVSLGSSLLGELGLNRHHAFRQRTIQLIAKDVDFESRTNEERRAYAGLFMLSSSISNIFGKVDSLVYTKYLDQCIRELELQKEYPSDEKLVALVRLQEFTQAVARANVQNDERADMRATPTPPMSQYAPVLQRELDSIVLRIPSRLRVDTLINICIQNALLRVYEPPEISREFIARHSQPLSKSGEGELSLLDMLYQSRSALVGVFDLWFSLTPEAQIRFPIYFDACLIYAITMFVRWAKLTLNKPVLQSSTASMSSDSPDSMPAASNSSYEPVQQLESRLQSVGISNLRHTSPQSHNSGSDLDLVNVPQRNREPTFIGEMAPSKVADSELPAAVGMFGEQKLQMQNELAIDAGNIVLALIKRIEQVSLVFMTRSVDPAAEQNDVPHASFWSMALVKAVTMKHRLDKWTELVREKTEAVRMMVDSPLPQVRLHTYQEEHINQFAMSGNEAFGPAGWDDGGMMTTSEWNQPIDPMSQDGTYDANAAAVQAMSIGQPWMTDLISGMDPNLWSDQSIDWGAFFANSMGGTE